MSIYQEISEFIKITDVNQKEKKTDLPISSWLLFSMCKTIFYEKVLKKIGDVISNDWIGGLYRILRL